MRRCAAVAGRRPALLGERGIVGREGEASLDVVAHAPVRVVVRVRGAPAPMRSAGAGSFDTHSKSIGAQTSPMSCTSLFGAPTRPSEMGTFVGSATPDEMSVNVSGFTFMSTE